jgi:quercetin dioxygenase-like cupin family protein
LSIQMKLTIPLLLPLLLLVPARAQSPVPIEEEPRHRLQFENRYVRVFDVLIPQGDESLYHIHKHDGVGIKLTDARIRDEKLGGKPEDLEVKRGAVNFARFPEALTHKVSNIGGTPFRNMFIEILPSMRAPANAPPLAGVPGHTLVLENDRVRVYRLVLAPGQSTETHAHALRGLGVAVSEGEIAFGAPGEKSKTVKFKPGDYLWHEGGATHSLRNVGTAPFEAVDIELK